MSVVRVELIGELRQHPRLVKCARRDAAKLAPQNLTEMRDGEVGHQARHPSGDAIDLPLGWQRKWRNERGSISCDGSAHESRTIFGVCSGYGRSGVGKEDARP